MDLIQEASREHSNLTSTDSNREIKTSNTSLSGFRKLKKSVAQTSPIHSGRPVNRQILESRTLDDHRNEIKRYYEELKYHTIDLNEFKNICSTLEMQGLYCKKFHHSFGQLPNVKTNQHVQIRLSVDHSELLIIKKVPA